jgi:hypothetical protein
MKTEPEGKPKLFLAALFTGCAIRVLFFFLSDNNGGDAVAHAKDVLAWMQHPTIAPTIPDWGPVYLYLNGTAGWLLGNAELAARLLSLLAGTALIPLVYAISRMLSDDEAGGLSAMVVAVSGLAVGYSTTSSTESLYLFFLVTGLWGWLEYQRSGRVIPLVAGGLGMAVSSGIRYESWVFLPLLSLLLIGSPREILKAEFWKSRRFRAILVFSLIAGSWALFWCAYSWKHFGDPLYAVHFNYRMIALAKVQQLSAHRGSRSLAYELALIPGVVLLGLSPLPLLGVVYGMWRLFGRPLARQLFWVTAGFIAVQFSHVIRGGTIAMARYTLTEIVLLAVFCGPGIQEFLRPLPLGHARLLRLLVIGTAVLTPAALLTVSELRTPFSDKVASVSPRLRYPHYMQDVSVRLRPGLGPEDGLIIDDYNGEANILAHALGLPLMTPDRVLLVRPQMSQEVRPFLETRRPKYMIYSDHGMIQQALRVPEGCTSGKLQPEISFHCQYANQVYRIYELSYP